MRRAKLVRMERVTITMPVALVDQIDRLAPNRSRFIVAAIRSAMLQLKRQRLRTSLRNPHPESKAMAEAGFDEWAKSLGDDGSDLVAPGSGTPVRWVPGRGWQRHRGSSKRRAR